MQCECGKVCGNKGALVLHRRSKKCPSNNRPVQEATDFPLNPLPPPSVAEDVVGAQVLAIQLEHEAKMRILNQEHEQRTKLNAKHVNAEVAVSKATKKMLVKKTEAEIEIMKAVAAEKIQRIQRTRDVYVKHVDTMTQLAIEDAHQHRLLTVCPHLLVSNEMRVFGTTYLPSFETGELCRFIDTHMAEGGDKADVKTLVGQMALVQDVKVETTVEPMNLVPLRALTQITRMAEELEDYEDEEEKADEDVEKEANNTENAGGNRLVAPFEAEEKVKRAIHDYVTNHLANGDAAAVKTFLEMLHATTETALASVNRHRVHVPKVLQDMIDEQCALKPRKSPHNKYEFWAKKTGNAVNHPCATCEKRVTCATFEMGHRVAKARGGTYNLDNMMVQCGTCNEKQGVLHPELFKGT